MRRSYLLAAIAALCPLASAEVKYTLQPINQDTQVTMTFAVKAGPVEVQMPNWAPGYYVLNNYGKDVKNFTWMVDGSTVAVSHKSVNSWKANLPRSGTATIQYSVPGHLEAGCLSINGPATYMYIVGRKEEACHLSLNLPADWKVAVGLDSVGDSPTEYSAPTYDVLADNPISAGDFVTYQFYSHGKPITIAVHGELRDKLDKAKIMKVCQVAADSEGDFFGRLPFNKYVFHLGVFEGRDGAGGLEHLSSTQISIAQGLGPGAAGVVFHEFFHLWNVKRIRSKVLGPFDYTVLPKTGALYWLEGVTDYYASFFMLRSHYGNEQGFLGSIGENLTSVRANPARLEISPYDSSYRVGEADDGRGNSDGYKISYYNLGWLVGLCLDIDLRSRTNNRVSLDTVERALWNLCRNDQPGFAEGEIERQYVKFGGSKSYFEKIVMKPGELPVAAALAKVGYKAIHESTKTREMGFAMTGAIGDPIPEIVDVWPFAASAGLKAHDALLEVNGTSIIGETVQISIQNVRTAFNSIRDGDPMTVKVHRGESEKVITFIPQTVVHHGWKVVDDGTTDKHVLSLRKSWLSGRTSNRGNGT